jgi:methanogenic corrinoid protein MtbC1
MPNSTSTNDQPLSSQPAGHPIAVVAERTGLSRDVLRVWERRYGAVEPVRSAGGQRLYTDNQIERFRLLAAATKHGRTISLVATLTNEQLQQLVADDIAALQYRTPSISNADTAAVAGNVADQQMSTRDVARNADIGRIIDEALAYTLVYDGAGLDRLMRHAVAEYGLPTALEEIIPYFMHRIGDEWMTDRLTIAHEHLASAAVMAIIHESIRAVPEREHTPRILIATPAGERHGIGAALVAATAALDGWAIVYLGVDVPAREIAAAAEAVNATVVGLSAVYAPDLPALRQEFTHVRRALAPDVALLIGGSAVQHHASDFALPGVTVCSSIKALRSELSQRFAA